MVTFHVVDEAVIAGTPQEIWDALADEALGAQFVVDAHPEDA